jgi:uncharacterized protein YndB with AHSA1/START domain
MAKIIKYDLFFPNSPSVVWEYITDPELIAQWLMKGNFKPVVGHEFTLTARPMPEMQFDGVFYCKVLEVEPPKKLSYSWQFGPGDGTMNNSVVNWTLTPLNGGTQLELVHRGFEGASFVDMFTSMSEGWIELINKFKKLLNPETDGAAKA